MIQVEQGEAAEEGVGLRALTLTAMIAKLENIPFLHLARRRRRRTLPSPSLHTYTHTNLIASAGGRPVCATGCLHPRLCRL